MGLSSGRVGHLTSGALPRDPDSVSLEWSRGTYIIKVFPGEEQAELRTAALVPMVLESKNTASPGCRHLHVNDLHMPACE